MSLKLKLLLLQNPACASTLVSILLSVRINLAILGIWDECNQRFSSWDRLISTTDCVCNVVMLQYGPEFPSFLRMNNRPLYRNHISLLIRYLEIFGLIPSFDYFLSFIAFNFWKFLICIHVCKVQAQEPVRKVSPSFETGSLIDLTLTN